MDKTKKYTLIGIIVAFILIGGISIYNATIPPQKDDSIIVKKEDDKNIVKKEETEEKLPEEENTSDKKPTPSEGETKKEEPKKPVQEEPKVEEPKQDITPTLKVNIIIKGIDSIIINSQVEIVQDQTVFDALKKITNLKGIELKTSGSGKLVYIRGINGLNEFDHGNQSGWTYYVNGTFPNQGAGIYKLKAGDQIDWIYTVDE